jgi:hypothetical protein
MKDAIKIFDKVLNDVKNMSLDDYEKLFYSLQEKEQVEPFYFDDQLQVEILKPKFLKLPINYKEYNDTKIEIENIDLVSKNSSLVYAA